VKTCPVALPDKAQVPQGDTPRAVTAVEGGEWENPCTSSLVQPLLNLPREAPDGKSVCFPRQARGERAPGRGELLSLVALRCIGTSQAMTFPCVSPVRSSGRESEGTGVVGNLLGEKEERDGKMLEAERGKGVGV